MSRTSASQVNYSGKARCHEDTLNSCFVGGPNYIECTLNSRVHHIFFGVLDVTSERRGDMDYCADACTGKGYDEHDSGTR